MQNINDHVWGNDDDFDEVKVHCFVVPRGRYGPKWVIPCKTFVATFEAMMIILVNGLSFHLTNDFVLFHFRYKY